MSIKLVVVDMDGTFLDDTNQYDRLRFAKIFRQLQARGIKFAVASGSQHQRLQAKFPEYLDDIFFISQNGSIIFDGQKFLGASHIPTAELATVLQKISQYPTNEVQVIVSGVEKTYLDTKMPTKMKKLFSEYFNALVEVPDIFKVSEATVNEPLTKVGVWFLSTDKTVQADIKAFRTSLPVNLASLSSGFNIELVGVNGVDKVTGIRAIQKQLGINDDEVMTFGDNENDVAMLALTPHSYAMANAAEQAKIVARNEAPSNNDAGVLTILEALLADELNEK